MVCRKVVGAFVEHLVVEYRGIDGDFSADQVIDLYFAPRLYEESDHILVACRDAAFHLFGGKGQRIVHVSACGRVILEIGYCRACGLEFFGCVERYVGFACVEKHLHMLAVYVAAFRLLVRTICPSFAHAFVDADAEPCERLVDIFLGTRHEPAAVSVLDA